MIYTLYHNGYLYGRFATIAEAQVAAVKLPPNSAFVMAVAGSAVTR